MDTMRGDATAAAYYLPVHAPSPVTAELESRVVEDISELDPYLTEWDQLAVASGRPFCAPAWMLAWWRHARSGDARLRVVLALDADGRLAGVGPFFAQIGWLRLAEYRLLAAGFSHRVGPLALAGCEAAVGAAIARGIAQADPAPASVVFEGLDAVEQWPELLAAAWPAGRTRLRTDVRMDAPVIDLEGDYEAWMARRDRRFRKEARRTSRRLQERGVHASLVAAPGAAEALLRLHDDRWRDRGGSSIDDRARRVILDAAHNLGNDAGRIAVAMLQAADGPIAAELVVRAGSTMAFWAGGFDAAWSQHAPGTQAMLTALADAAEQEVMLVDLGGGAHEYKRRIADRSAPLVWRTLFPLSSRYPLIRIRLAPKHARVWLRSRFRRLPPEVQGRLRRALRT